MPINKSYSRCACKRLGLVFTWLIWAMPHVALSGQPLYLQADQIHVGNGKVLTQAGLLIRDGKIVAVGQNLNMPAGTVIIEMPGGSITPGLIDANASLEAADLMTPRGYYWSQEGEGHAHHQHDSHAGGEQDTHTAHYGDTHSWWAKLDALATAAPKNSSPFITPATPAFSKKAGRFSCCGSTCPRTYAHVDGQTCPACGFPNTANNLAVGTRSRKVLAEASSEVIPHTRVLDSINLRSPDFDRLLSGGVTTVYASPHPAAVISSQGAILHTGGSMATRVLRQSYAVKAAMGTDPSWLGGGNQLPFRNSVSFRTRRPTTRMGVTWVFRKAFHDAKLRAQGQALHGADTPSSIALDTIDQILKGDIPLRIQARTQQDILSAIRLSHEFGLSFTLEEATEAYLCLDEILKEKLPVIFGPIYVRASGHRVYSAEVSESRLHTFKSLLDKGIETALTAHEMRDEAGLSRQAMYALRSGVTLSDVLRAVTLTPAKLLNLDRELGSLEKGKRADVVVWSGEPFAATSKPVLVVIDGEVVLDQRS